MKSSPSSCQSRAGRVRRTVVASSQAIRAYNDPAHSDESSGIDTVPADSNTVTNVGGVLVPNNQMDPKVFLRIHGKKLRQPSGRKPLTNVIGANYPLQGVLPPLEEIVLNEQRITLETFFKQAEVAA